MIELKQRMPSEAIAMRIDIPTASQPLIKRDR